MISIHDIVYNNVYCLQSIVEVVIFFIEWKQYFSIINMSFQKHMKCPDSSDSAGPYHDTLAIITRDQQGTIAAG